MIGLFILITFVVLKLTHVINWSWWWVLSPLWIGFVIDIISHVVGGIGLGVISLINRFKERRERKRMAHIEDTLGVAQEAIEHPLIEKTKRSKKRVAFCIIGVILYGLAIWQSNIAYEYSEYYEWTTYDTASVALFYTASFFTILGSYLWAKEKGRSWRWGAMGLIAPFGYLVLMKLKDKRVDEKETTGKALSEIETDFKEITSTQVKNLGNHDVQ